MLTYFRNIGQGILTIVNSMAVASRHLFKPSVTLQYPKEKWAMPERSRMRLHNKVEDCIGCGQCARTCPTDCILVKTEKRGKEEPPVFAADGTAKKLRTYVFDIDMALCCYCGLCTFACPTQCLVMTGDYEYSVYSIDEHIYHFAKEKPLIPAGSKEQSPSKG
ncbi:MAG: NADH-quinone oxidoreductase subunit I [Acidobacteria bacterium]|nr:NADH-quinone oxidoreductase subunit I [Acidobacteriota bacterium]